MFKNTSIFFVFSLGMLCAFAPMCTDVYLPALPQVVDTFNTTTSLAQSSLTASFLGLALGQLIIGPVSDTYGRTKPLIISLVLFAISSFFCAIAPTITLFILFRVLQGMCASGGIVLTRSIACDLYKGHELTSFMAFLMSINSLAPILAPLLGSLILSFVSWVYIFYILCAWGILMLIMAKAFVKESLPNDKRDKSVKASLQRMKTDIFNLKFMLVVLSLSFIMAGFFSYLAASPFVFQRIYEFSAFEFSLPTVTDRFVQQAVALVLSEEYEKVFSDNSFGFRPNRSCNKAVTRALEYINSGLEWVIDLDLSKFFDTVNHSKLLQLLSDKIKDGRVISLIHKFLKAPICEDGKVSKKNTIGTPQGGVISPILANILLNELDQLLDSRGIKFVRYADDMVILCSKKAAERILANVTKFIEKKLFLKVNTDKTKILQASEKCQFLGFGFTQKVAKWKKELYPTQKFFAVVHEKKQSKLIKVLRVITDRRAKGGIENVKRTLKLKLQGWFNYFKDAIPMSWMIRLDKWLRRRIRQLLWKQWKKPENRHREFAKRLTKCPSLDEYAYSSNSYWRMARTPQINKALSIKNLENEGWVSLKGLDSASI